MKILFGLAVLGVLASPASASCISSCVDRADGDYQSCVGCNVYATCSNGLLSDNRPCPEDLVWDDVIKRCEWSSTTCPDEDTPSRPCVSSCRGKADGDYQSCLGCNVYATCSNEIMYDNRPCPADLVWDDNIKRCEYESDTCGDEDEPETGEGSDIDGSQRADETDTVGDKSALKRLLSELRSVLKSEDPPSSPCVSSCEGQEDGDYQSCNGCDVYVTCSNEIISDNRPCPDGLVWDDNKKRCEYESETCLGEDTPSSSCVSSCEGQEDGDYQSCNGCDVYVTCSNEIIADDRPCPDDLVWDDNKKRCEYESETCQESSDEEEELETDEGSDADGAQEAGTKGRSFTDLRTVLRGKKNKCIKSCKGKKDGDYQSCEGCNVYATCSNQVLYDNRPCPANLVWDDKKKRCEWKSDTCKPELPCTDMSCASNGYRYAECTLPSMDIDFASLTKQVSKSACKLGDSFGVNDNGLWVKDGCRGNFKVCECSRVKEISCSSWSYKYAECRASRRRSVLNVNLLKQNSRSECQYGKSFGVKEKSIWVDNGCRALFSVCF